jgi:hypothetical protein
VWAVCEAGGRGGGGAEQHTAGALMSTSSWPRGEGGGGGGGVGVSCVELVQQPQPVGHH